MPKKSIKKVKDVESDDEANENIDEPDINEDNEIIDDDEDEKGENNELDDEEYELEGDVNCNIDDYLDEVDVIDDDILEPETFTKSTTIESTLYVSKENRISMNRLTKYEMVRILGERTKQLTMGAKPLIKNYGSLSYDNIAINEFKLNMIPYKIKRPLPNGTFELWDFEELYKEHLYSLLE
jgi:DNA-directed RNA polymerase subunit K/omega